jgi:fructose-bisphosphate aldolase class 1
VRALALSGETLNDEAIEHLKRMKHLRRLDLMSVSQEFGRTLSDQLPNCQVELPPYNQ